MSVASSESGFSSFGFTISWGSGGIDGGYNAGGNTGGFNGNFSSSNDFSFNGEFGFR